MKKFIFLFFLGFLLLFSVFSPEVRVLYAEQGDRFVFAQLKYAGNWNPYPEVSREILNFLRLTTSVKVLPERRVVALDDELLFSSPFLIILGQENFPVLKEKEVETLNRYLKGGGTIFIDESSGQKGSSFDKAIRREFARILPDSVWIKLPKDEHPVFRSFYLLRSIGGRRIVNNYLEGINLSGQTAVIYSQNDLFSVWVKDRLGNYLFSCSPGGEIQRSEATKLTANIFIYALTGTYKTDFIHQPFIKEKMHRRR